MVTSSSTAPCRSGADRCRGECAGVSRSHRWTSWTVGGGATAGRVVCRGCSTLTGVRGCPCSWHERWGREDLAAGASASTCCIENGHEVAGRDTRSVSCSMRHTVVPRRRVPALVDQQGFVDRSRRPRSSSRSSSGRRTKHRASSVSRCVRRRDWRTVVGVRQEADRSSAASTTRLVARFRRYCGVKTSRTRPRRMSMYSRS